MEGEVEGNAQEGLTDAEAASLQSTTETDEFTPKGRGDEKPYSRAKERIQGLVQEKKQLYADYMAEKASKQEIVDKLKNLESKLEAVASKANEKPGTFDTYGSDDLYALKAKYMDGNDKDYSPAMAVKLEQEINRRNMDTVEKKLRLEYETKNRIVADNQRVFNETRAMLGDAGRDLDNPESPLHRLARQKYIEMARQHGEDRVANDPTKQQNAILLAYMELQKAGAVSSNNREAELLRAKMKAKESLSAQGEAAVEEASEVKGHLARRDIKKAFSALPLLKEAAGDIESMVGRRRR